MSIDMRQVRIDNIKRAKKSWKLKLEGMDNELIARQLSTSYKVINDIIDNTNAEHYTIFRDKPSYYDEEIIITNRITAKKTKLQSTLKSIAFKKKIFSIILQVTFVLLTIIVLI